MREYVIITDTNSDLPEPLVNKLGLLQVPQYTTLDGVTYEGARGVNPKEFYEKMRNGSKPLSQACNPAVVDEVFRSVLEKNCDILYISFASALSGSYNNVVLAANDLKEEFPEAVIEIIDSVNVSLSEGLLVLKAVEGKQAGKTLEENAAWLNDIKLNILVKFTVDDLHHLQRGGRVSKTTAVVGSILNIKPILALSKEGKLEAQGTVRGRKKSLLSLVSFMEEHSKGFESLNNQVAIVHGDCLEDARFVEEQIKSRLGIQNVIINDINPSIGVHSGPGAVGLLFFGDERES